jgi:hypothetical protein
VRNQNFHAIFLTINGQLVRGPRQRCVLHKNFQCTSGGHYPALKMRKSASQSVKKIAPSTLVKDQILVLILATE